ncbi:MAG: hypothetical protein QHG99_00940 [Methanomicrobiales archaeon]|nr:hypothetical protein [Methanomicrobiales archaeon]
MFDRGTFSRKMEDEINRLEKTASKLKGKEKELVLEMAKTLRVEQRQIGSSLFEELEWDQAAIIRSLNDIESVVANLEKEMSVQKNTHALTTVEAEDIVNKFFVSCQVAEDAMKKAYSRGTISSKQMDDLNAQLRQLVRRMIRLSKRSETLLDAMLYALEAKIVA